MNRDLLSAAPCQNFAVLPVNYMNLKINVED